MINVFVEMQENHGWPPACNALAAMRTNLRKRATGVEEVREFPSVAGGRSRIEPLIGVSKFRNTQQHHNKERWRPC